MQINMSYHCSVCDKIFEPKRKNNHFKSLRHNQYEKSIRINYIIKNPDFFDIDKIFNVYISNHNEKFGLYLFKCEYKPDFINWTPDIKIDFYHNTTID